VNAKNDDGLTALMIAAYEGQADRVKDLIAAGADINAKDNYHETALLKAVFVARQQVYYLPPQAPSPAQQVGLLNFNATTGMKGYRQIDAGAGNLDCVEALIAAGADLNAKDRDGMTALIESSEQNNVSCVKALIAAGADVNIRDRNGDTALMLANADVAAILQAAGAKN
jgi:ankyrin repeat protein